MRDNAIFDTEWKRTEWVELLKTTITRTVIDKLSPIIDQLTPVEIQALKLELMEHISHGIGVLDLKVRMERRKDARRKAYGRGVREKSDQEAA